MTIAASVAGGGCSRRYRCAARGDVSALGAWLARGFGGDGPRAQVCEASATRFDAVYTAPPSWDAAWHDVEDALDHDGWHDSPRRGYAPHQGERDALGIFERCTTLGGGRLLQCTDELRLVVTALPGERGLAAFTIEADYSPAVHHYSFGDRREGPIPAFAHH
jgi:hypothetical protein